MAIERKCYVKSQLRRVFCEQCGIGTAHDNCGCINCDMLREMKGKAGGNATVPASLDTDDFHRAWREWEQHRKEKRSKLTPTATKRQLKKLEALGHDRAIAAIEHSITNGYTGIFEPSGGIGPVANISRVAAKPGKYANVGETVDANFPPATREGG